MELLWGYVWAYINPCWLALGGKDKVYPMVFIKGGCCFEIWKTL